MKPMASTLSAAATAWTPGPFSSALLSESTVASGFLAASARILSSRSMQSMQSR